MWIQLRVSQRAGILGECTEAQEKRRTMEVEGCGISHQDFRAARVVGKTPKSAEEIVIQIEHHVWQEGLHE